MTWQVKYASVWFDDSRSSRDFHDDGRVGLRVWHVETNRYIPLKFGRNVDAMKCAEWLNAKCPGSDCRETMLQSVRDVFGNTDEMIRQMLTECLAW